MMRLLFAFVFILTFQAGDTPTPPPFDPAQIFVDGINPEHIDDIPIGAAYYDKVFYSDFDTRTIYLRDEPGGQWQRFPFPSDADNFACGQRRSDGTWYISDYCGHYADNGLEHDWILDPSTGIYTPPEAVCGERVKALPGEGEWKFTGDQTDQHRVLCFTEDGRIHDVLTRELEWRTLTTSPDGQYAVVIGSGQVYSYHRETEALRHLGEAFSGQLNPSVEFGEWVSETRGTIIAKDQRLSYPTQRYYAFDITRSDSIEVALRGWYETIEFQPEGRRYMALMTESYYIAKTGLDPQDDFPCELMMYDAGGVYHENLGYSCVPMAVDISNYGLSLRAGDQYFYLSVDRENDITRLYSFDLIEKRRTSIFMGDLVSILGVSPDETYIAVALEDTKGQFPPLSCVRCDGYPGIHVAVLDITRHAIVYLSENVGVYSWDQLVWLDNTTFVFWSVTTAQHFRGNTQGDTFSVRIPGFVRHIELGEDRQFREQTDSYLAALGEFKTVKISPNKRYWLTTHGVVDLRTFEYTPVLRETLPDDYEVWSYWYDAETLYFNIQHQDKFLALYQVKMAD